MNTYIYIYTHTCFLHIVDVEKIDIFMTYTSFHIMF